MKTSKVLTHPFSTKYCIVKSIRKSKKMLKEETQILKLEIEMKTEDITPRNTEMRLKEEMQIIDLELDMKVEESKTKQIHPRLFE